VAAELAYRIFGQTSDPEASIYELSTGVLTGGLLATAVAALLVCWLRYRRIEDFR
jgi:hypothetical protein